MNATVANEVANTEMEYALDKNLNKEDVKALVKWTKQQPHLPDITEYQAILFLKKCFYFVQPAKITIEIYYTLNKSWPEIFAERNFSDPSITGALDALLISVLPTKTPEGYSVVFMKTVSPEIVDYKHQTFIKLYDCVSVLNLHQKGSSKGHIIVFDLDGFPEEYLSKLDLVALKKYIYYMQEIMPIMGLKGMHFFNPPYFVDEFVNNLQSSAPKSLITSIMSHVSLESLAKFVPKECLPQDYGGSGTPVSALLEKMKSEILINAGFLNGEDQQGVIERGGSSISKFGNNFFGFNNGTQT